MRRREFVAGSVAAFLTGAPAEGSLEIVLGAKTVSRYYYGAQWDKPFLYPLQTVSGRLISRGFPLEKRDGETSDHEWHRGIWYGHGLINGHDFWRELGREKTSRLVATGPPSLTKRGESATVRARFAMITPSQETLGHITQAFTIRDSGRFRYIDAAISTAADAGRALTFGDTEDGGFAFRLSDRFREDRGARLINDSGRQGTNDIWGKPAKWIDYSAEADGSRCGAAIFDHPSNFRHPTTWHARGYGLCSANPFGLGDFSGDRTRDGRHTVAVGRRMDFRYRVLIHEGVFEPEEIAREYVGFAKG